MNWLFLPFSSCPDLRPWSDRPYSPGAEAGPVPGDLHGCYERVVAWESPGPPRAEGVFRRLTEAVFAFDVFPPALVMGATPGPRVQVGDAVGVCYHFLPGLDLFFAARVYEQFDAAADGVWRCGFSYRTLRGHPACGEETFSVEKDLRTGTIQVALRSWSRPGLWVARLARPWMRWQQRRAAVGALDHLEAIARGAAVGTVMPRRGRDLRTNLLRGAGEW